MRDSSLRKGRDIAASAALVISSLAGLLLFVIFARTRFEFETSTEPGRFYHIIGSMLLLSPSSGSSVFRS